MVHNLTKQITSLLTVLRAAMGSWDATSVIVCRSHDEGGCGNAARNAQGIESTSSRVGQQGTVKCTSQLPGDSMLDTSRYQMSRGCCSAERCSAQQAPAGVL